MYMDSIDSFFFFCFFTEGMSTKSSISSSSSDVKVAAEEIDTVGRWK